MALHDVVTLLASAARTADGTGEAVLASSVTERLVNRPYKGLALVLDVTVDEATAADKLDVKVQTQLDGVNWVDVCAFTQHAGNAGETRYVAKLTRDLTQAMFTDGVLSAGAIRNLLGNKWRAVWAVIDDSGSASFTFSVVAIPQ